jgi:hypothetical protein
MRGILHARLVHVWQVSLLGIRGDGSTAQLVRPGTGDSDQAAVKHDLAGLGAVMLDLISAQAR